MQTTMKQTVIAAAGIKHREYLCFRLGTEEYGIDILKVREIRGYEQPTRMTNAPTCILGVVNLRGDIVPIIDLRIKFGLSEAQYDHQTVIIVLDIGSRVIGVIVDAVLDVTALESGDIKPAPEFGGAQGTDHIIGIATLQEQGHERLLILLEIEQLMGTADIGLLAQ